MHMCYNTIAIFPPEKDIKLYALALIVAYCLKCYCKYYFLQGFYLVPHSDEPAKKITSFVNVSIALYCFLASTNNFAN